MKKSTQILSLAAMVALSGLPAAAQAVWQRDENEPFQGVQSSYSMFADLNNNGRLDIIYTGVSNVDEWQNLPGVWSWNDRTNIYFNNGDGSWNPSIFVPVKNGTYMDNLKDENGNDVLDESGNPVQIEKDKYVLQATHGLPAMAQCRMVPFDYNNDGKVDLFVVGIMSNNENLGFKEMYQTVPTPGNGDYGAFVALFKNLGEGKFERVENHGIPYFRFDDDDNDGRGMFHPSIAVADYDRDGYTDIFVCGKYCEEQPEGYPSTLTALFRNVNGSGKFERKDIAKVQGGVWTAQIDERDDEGNVLNIIKEKEELPGWFLPINNNVHFVDLNNDGWVDIITDGWASGIWDGVNEAGANIRIYLNRAGEAFEDVTPLIPALGNTNIPRSSCSVVADFDKDGYMDFFSSGWIDGGVGPNSRQFLNQLGFSKVIFEDFGDQSLIQNEGGQEGEWLERTHTSIRDFNGDGMLDILFDGKGDSYIYYGQLDGTFMRAPQLDSRGHNALDGRTGVGDVTGNGLADQFRVGYNWATFVDGGWHWAAHLFKNVTEAEVKAPAVPTQVAAEISDGMINISWKDSEADSYTAGYNVFVKKPNGELVTVIPADPETGFVRIADGKEILIRPMVEKYSIPAIEDGKYTVGVQAVSLYTETASAFATASTSLSGIATVEADHSISVSVNGNEIIVNAPESEAVKVINVVGQTVAAGVANSPINVSANGVLIVTCGDKTVKIAK